MTREVVLNDDKIHVPVNKIIEDYFVKGWDFEDLKYEIKDGCTCVLLIFSKEKLTPGKVVSRENH